MRKRLALFMTMFLLVLSACSGGGDAVGGDESTDGDLDGGSNPEIDSSICHLNSDCPEDFYCDNGVCREADCFTHDDCDEGYLCDDHLCIKDPNASDGDLEDPLTDGDLDESAPDGDLDPEPEIDLEVICDPDDKMCQADLLWTCNAEGTQWVEPENCPPNTVCIVDACVASACDPDTYGQCVSEFTIYQCNSQGTGWEEVPCPANNYCEDGACLPIECEPNAEIECVDTETVKICTAEGNDWITEACPENTTCYGTGCLEIICDAGDWRCEDNVLYYCNALGAAWDEIMDCSDDGAICTEGSCMPEVCEAGVKACDETNPKLVEICNETGTAWVESETCAGTDECRGGACMSLCEIAAFDKSYVGCDYWPVDLDNSARDDGGEFALVVANPQSFSVDVRVSDSASLLQTKTIAAGGLDVFQLGSGHLITGPGKTSAAYHVNSDAPVTVTQMNPYGNVLIYSNDASLLLPEGALGTDYMGLTWPTHRMEDCYCDFWLVTCFSWTCDGRDTPGFLAITATQPGSTSVSVTYSGATQAGGGVNAESAGTTRSYTLQQFEVLNLESAGTNCPNVDEETYIYCDGPDLTGSTITSDKPVAVYGGHRCTFIPKHQWACDHLEHQLFPVETWGKNFIAVRTEPRHQEQDYYKIVASEDGTVVTLSPDPTGQSPHSLNAGQSWLFSTINEFSITSTKPVMMAHFLAGQDATGLSVVFDDCNGNDAYCAQYGNYECVYNGGYYCSPKAGDPAMMLLAPNEQFRRQYIFLIPPNYEYDHITLIAPPDATITLDGTTTLDSNTFPSVTSEYRRARMSLPDGQHLLVSDKPVGLYVYGYSAYVSYAYTGGLDLKEINPKP